MSIPVQILAGPPAFSRAGLQGKLARIRALDPRVGGAFAEFVHLLFLDHDLDDAQRRLVDALLDYGPRRGLAAKVGTARCLVVPRPGTVSPWSSKATDIFRRCGLRAVAKVERGVRWYFEGAAPERFDLLHDRMTEAVIDGEDVQALGVAAPPGPLRRLALGDDPPAALRDADSRLGLALSDAEIEYLAQAFADLGRDPADVELMMFAQANSEHCRHKIFNADWLVDGERQPKSLFAMIRNTYNAINGAGILSAYSDNAAVVEAPGAASRFLPDADRIYRPQTGATHLLMKVETHNHPTAIAPHPGAATGAGGEIRDEGAVGRGSKPRAGLVGFTTSHIGADLEPTGSEPTVRGAAKPNRIASALDIMLQAPLGAAAFNNEYGRPCLGGYFRTFEAASHRLGETWGYHKPVMIAGGVGTVAAEHVRPDAVPLGAKLVILGGPAMLIGLGGGAASSIAAGEGDSELDFASVQRGNAEMQRRCQEVIDRCCALGAANPIRLIHDVGAGGLSNALPELVHEAMRGGRFDIRAVPSADTGLSPLEIWCNEAQERYVLAVDGADLSAFDAICARERCPYAVVGEATEERNLVVDDSLLDEQPAALPLSTLLGKPPKMTRAFSRTRRRATAFDHRGIDLGDAIERVLRLPAVASKKFLVTIGDRSVGGLVARDQMVGPRQVPVADVAVTTNDFETYRGAAMAMGERPPVAVIDPAAAARLAVAEALTNIAAAPIDGLEGVVLSANWMAAAGHEGEDQALFDAVRAVGEELCPALGIAIPVGKDSLSMRTTWGSQTVVSPVTLNVSAFADVADVRLTLTPDMNATPRRGAAREDRLSDETNVLYLIEPLFSRRRRLGGSALAQCYGALGDTVPDIDDAAALKALIDLKTTLAGKGLITCYHDRSDGGLVATLVEMAFASGCGLNIFASDDPIPELFAEEIGMVIGIDAMGIDATGVDNRRAGEVCAAAEAAGLAIAPVASRRDDQRIVVAAGSAQRELFASTRADLERVWASTSHSMQRRRDDADCADQEFAAIADAAPLLAFAADFDTEQDIAAPYVASGVRPRVAILREQGVNGQIEMAAAFHRAGFAAIDVHMTDLFANPDLLQSFQALAACGGFSYGDVLGGGGGWAKSILFENRVRDAFAAFFARADTLALGICNGCQMLAQAKELIPGADMWPRFVGNRSERFEARTALVRVAANHSPWLVGMAGALLPIPVAHGEGRPEFDLGAGVDDLARQGGVALQYVEADGTPTERYPHNPNGAAQGLAGVIAADGRVLATMPHPERAFRAVQNSWTHPGWGEDGPWLRLFRNARVALG